MIPIFLPQGGGSPPPLWYFFVALCLSPIASYGFLRYADCYAMTNCVAFDYAFFTVMGLGVAVFWPITGAIGLMAYGLYWLTH